MFASVLLFSNFIFSVHIKKSFFYVNRKSFRRMREIKVKNFFHSRCCRVCAKVEGEACGGPGGFSGTCEPQLKCITKMPFIETGVCLCK